MGKGARLRRERAEQRVLDEAEPRTQVPMTDPEEGEAALLLFSIPVPQPLPLDGPITVHIDEQFIRNKGYDPAWVDQDVIPLPNFFFVDWVRVPRAKPLAATQLIGAARALEQRIPELAAPGESKPPAVDPKDEESSTSEWDSVAICRVPVLNIHRALTSTTDSIDAFTLAHWVLQDTVRAVRTSEVLPLRDLNYGSLPDVVLRSVGRLRDGEMIWSDPQPYFLENFMRNFRETPRDVLDAAKVREAGNALASLAAQRPASIVRDLLSNAKASRRDGDLRSAMVNFAITCEVALDQLLFSLLWEDGVSPAGASAVFDGRLSVAKRVRTLYHPRLEGRWITEGPGAIAGWYQVVAQPRNLVVHRGTIPASQEVDAAETATHNLTSFIVERLVKSFSKYPKTMAIFTGETSINKHAKKSERPKLLSYLDSNRESLEKDFASWLDQWWK